MSTIKKITFRIILNSHVEFTTEFIVELEDGSVGFAAPPKGETISIYEDKKITVDPATIIQIIERDGFIGKKVDQETFDEYLMGKIKTFGRNNAFGLSLAFFNAESSTKSVRQLFGKEIVQKSPPYLCLNILNGGHYAYTNPILSDFSEFMLVAKHTGLQEIIESHNAIQRVVRERLINQPKTVVSGNPVSRFGTLDNRECIEFLLNICSTLGVTNTFDLMIDASAGDLWTAAGYLLSITDNKLYPKEGFQNYWLDLIRQYGLRFLEDPFYEEDYESWQRLTASQTSCYVIGDNFYSSDAKRIADGAANQYAHGAVIKPNQAGTVSAVRRAVEIAQQKGQIAITSHRSISTEETFLSILTCMYGVKYIKIGPLMSDYSSILRLNEIIRLTEVRL
jgi:enolase